MNASDERRLAFIHIHKTAGGSVRDALTAAGFTWNRLGGEAVPNHIGAADLLRRHPETRDWRLFTIVRNPWSRLTSVYLWTLEMADQDPKAPGYRHYRDHARARFRDMGGFEGYVEHVHAAWREVRPLDRFNAFACLPDVNLGADFDLQIYPSQASSACDLDGAPLVDAFGRFEALEADLTRLFGRYGLPGPPQLPHIHRSSLQGRDYRELYTSQRLIDAVGEVYAEDARLFGYTFDGIASGAAGA